MLQASKLYVFDRFPLTASWWHFNYFKEFESEIIRGKDPYVNYLPYMLLPANVLKYSHTRIKPKYIHYLESFLPNFSVKCFGVVISTH